MKHSLHIIFIFFLTFHSTHLSALVAISPMERPFRLSLCTWSRLHISLSPSTHRSKYPRQTTFSKASLSGFLRTAPYPTILKHQVSLNFNPWGVWWKSEKARRLPNIKFLCVELDYHPQLCIALQSQKHRICASLASLVSSLRNCPHWERSLSQRTRRRVLYQSRRWQQCFEKSMKWSQRCLQDMFLMPSFGSISQKAHIDLSIYCH